MKIGLYKLTSCSGCILEFITVFSRNPDLLNRVELYSPLLSDEIICDKYDAVFVEGSISNLENESFVQELRNRSRFFIAIGNCSIQGGLQNNTLEYNKPVSSVVKVDYILPGCPVNTDLLLNLLFKILLNGLDIKISESLCIECKRNNITCILIDRRIPCMGPLTRSGCGALCPRIGRNCIGCNGLREDVSIREIDLFREVVVKMGFPLSVFNKYIGSGRNVQ
ncbi:MAG: hypothetical protein QXX35_05050 [Desulfurococcaceae archaeon]